MEQIENPYQTEEGYLNVELLLKEVKLFGYLVGARNVGKTYGFLLHSIRESLKDYLSEFMFKDLTEFKKLDKNMASKYQFFFLRRYITQAKEAAKGLILPDFYQDFKDELNERDPQILEAYELFVDYDGNADGIREIQMIFENRENRKDRKRITIGYISAISAAEKIRKTGFPYVKIILFDEFQSKKNWDYIPNEPRELLDIFDSITRERNDDCKLFALGNSGTILNPHFAYFNYDEFDQIKTEKRNGAVIFYHFPNVPKSRESGLFRDLIEGTSYGDYALNNQFGDMERFNVIKLAEATAPRKCIYNVNLMGQELGIWRDGDNHIILSRITDPEKLLLVDRTPVGRERLDLQTYYILAEQLKNKYLYFDSPDLRLLAEKHLRRYIFKTDATSEWKTI